MTVAGAYLRAFLAPLDAWLSDAGVTDILINRPGEVWIERLGQPMRAVAAPDLTATALQRLAQQIAAISHQGVNREHPLLAATLPDGVRVQIVSPPATRGSHAFAFRKHIVQDLTLDEIEAAGGRRLGETPAALQQDAGLASLLRAAVRAGKNILISGGTGSGKTTMLNALLKEMPAEERLVMIEDTPEVSLTQANAVGLVAVRGRLGEAQVTLNDLLEASLRMRPDRILLGEVRGAEAFTFLRAINTGHRGAITTIHADSPRGAFEQLAFMALQAGLTLRREEVVDYATRTIDVVVQLSRADGKRVVSELYVRPT